MRRRLQRRLERVRSARGGITVRLPAPPPGAGGDPLATSDGALQAFVAEVPEERTSIARFVMRCASETPQGQRILDAGAGDSPYRHLFAHAAYTSADWPNSIHEGGRRADIAASLEDLPVDDSAFDRVLCTQVLEHVPEPATVLAELSRVLRPGGELWLTVPLAWPLHEEPFDFFRYTPHSLRHLVEGAGLEVLEIEPRNGYFATLGQLCRISPWSVGRPDDAEAQRRRALTSALAELGRALAAYDELDALRIFPLGYAVRARRP